MTPAPLVAVHGLVKRYGGRTVLDGLGFTLAPGAILGFVGANGGGKTTALRILAGLLRPDAGGGEVLGVDLARPAALRGRVGYMAQRLGLYPDLTVAENLRFHAAAHRLPAAAAGDAARRCGLAPVLTTRFDRLSGGWARRAQFAAVTVARPLLLLLDEPTAGLDPLTRRELWRWLGASAAEGAAVVISTHDLAEAERCPAIIHFEDGRPRGPFAPAALAADTGAATLEEAVLTLAERRA